MDNQKLEQLLVEKTTIIFKYLINIGASVEDAEDIVQDTLYKAVKYSDSLYQDHIFSWLFKVSLNSYYNLHKQKSRRTEIILDEGKVSALFAEDDLEGFVVNQELKRNVQIVLNSMKESYKTLIVLRYFMELSYKEIGDLLGFSESKVKTYLYRARNKFRGIWEEAGYDR